MAKKPDKAPEESAEGAPPAKSKKKLIIIIGILVVLLAGLGAGGWFGYKWWMGKKAATADNATEQSADAGHGEKKDEKGGHGEKDGKKDEKASGPEGGGELVSLPPLLVNLAEPQGRRYLKLALDIEVKDKPAAELLTKNMAKVKDSLLLLLSSKTYEDLASLENKILLKKEIVERLTLVLGEQKVLRVYITEIVIQ